MNIARCSARYNGGIHEIGLEDLDNNARGSNIISIPVVRILVCSLALTNESGLDSARSKKRAKEQILIK